MAQPLSGVGDNGQFAWFHQLVSTHSPLEERIALLREL
jgi:Zn-dependent protease with chaperone function